MHIFNTAARFVAFLGMVLAASSNVAAQNKRTYTFGVAPQMSLARLAGLWIPLIKLVADRAGVDLKFETAPDVDEYHKRVYAAAYDIAYTNPLVYVLANKKHGYDAFAKEKDRKLIGIFVVRNDSSIKTLADLRGKKISLPPSSAFAANMLNRVALENAGLRPGKDFDIKEVASHDSAYLLAFHKLSDAAGGGMHTFKAMPANVQAELHVLNATPGYTPHPFSARPSVPAEVVAKVRDALIAVGGDPSNQKLLEELQMKAGFMPANDAEYGDARTFAGAAIATSH